jgi:hypothetical protein
VAQGATYLLCLAAAACAGSGLTGSPPALEASPAAVAADPVPSAPPARAAGTRPAVRGPQPHRDDPPPETSDADPLTQARADCWMKVENPKTKRNLDQRIAFVDKCVADTMKGKSQ